MTCFRCGVCCKKFQARLSVTEARAIAVKMGLPWEDFKKNCIDSRWPGTSSLLLRHQNGACVFLENTVKGNNTCRIHEFKPEVCIEWTASLNQQECRQGLLKAWGLKVNDLQEITGSADDIKRFQTYLDSLQ